MMQRQPADRPVISREAMNAAEEVFHQLLTRLGLKHTGQRYTILRCFLEAREQLSAEQLHQVVRRRDPGIGFTAVYRTLKLLTQCGLASEAGVYEGVARYQHPYNLRDHHHLRCNRCGNSVEFFSPEVERLARELGRKYRYQVALHFFQIQGLCENCLHKTRLRLV